MVRLSRKFENYAKYEEMQTMPHIRYTIYGALFVGRNIVLGVPLLLIISRLLALMINASPKWDKYKYLYLLPMAIPAATMVLVWRLLFARQGFLNRLLETHVDFLGEGSAFYIVLGSYLWKNLGYTLVLWLAGLKAVPGTCWTPPGWTGRGSWSASCE